MRVTVSVEYALQALLEIAEASESAQRISARNIARNQGIPVKFLESILVKLKRAGFIGSSRGPQGGYLLTKKPAEIAIADVIRTIEGPLAAVGDRAPESTRYRGSAKNLTKLWIAARISLRSLFEEISLEDVRNGSYPRMIEKKIGQRESWRRRPSTK
jgi:Rrf2 family protein